VRFPPVAEVSAESDYETDPRLPIALATLSARQRGAVMLVHAYGYDLATAAQVLGCSVSSLRNHVARGLRRLRSQLGDESDA
jgi:DNA-directed RNA polymerase specialized sigma24 family protein